MNAPAKSPLTAEAVFDWLADLADRHDASSAAFREAALGHLKQELKAARATAEQQLMADGKGSACARLLSNIHDELMRALYRFASTIAYPALNPSTSERVSVIAVGGYGRGTMAPGSDIDLLFVLPYKRTGWSESVIEYMLYTLWDLGLKVGHSTRSIDECIRLAKADGTILTAVLEARYVCGDEPLSLELDQRFRSEVIDEEAEAFIADKLAERDQRHERAGRSRYLVEPDVKDGKGGMRDLHTLFWIAKFLHGAKDSKTLQNAGIFTRAELNRFMKCEDFQWAVRCHLHFMTGRGDDRLGFDRQSELADRLGYTAHAGLSHIERFMRHYFLIAKDVGDLTRIFCAVLEAQQIKQAPRMSRFFSRLRRRPDRRITESTDFHLDTGRLNVTSDDRFQADPVNLIRLFALADKYNVGIHPNALKLVRRSLSLINKEVRSNPEANRLFLEMLTADGDPETILRRMNEAGVLGKFVPDFGKIVAMMQFNMYHHYTVDEHLLRSVGALAEIENGASQDELPLSTDIIHTLKSRKVLYVAVFLHDIAKGRKEHHSIAGERVAKSLCPRLGLTPSETETVAWLVRHHLLMSETAQMRDLNDYK
ncbi:MAG: [protein-PII] uridylyltransferase, partial [Aestuariivirgaceae bacterium]